MAKSFANSRALASLTRLPWLLALGACGIDIMDHTPPTAYVAATLDQVRRTVDQLPTNDVIWEHALDVRDIRRMTLGVEYLYIEADQGRLIAVNRFTGIVAWMWSHPTGHMATWAPVEVPALIESRLAYEAREAALLDEIRRLSMKTKLTDAELDQIDALRTQRANEGAGVRDVEPWDNLYLITDNTLHCLDRRAGRHLWSRTLTYAASARPAASRGIVFVSCAHPSRVYAHSVEERGFQTTFYRAVMTTRDNFVTESPVYDAPNVIFPSNDGSVYAYDSSSGRDPSLAWLFNTGDTLRAPLSMHDFVENRREGGDVWREVKHRLVFASALNRQLYAIEGGALLWKADLGGFVNGPAIGSGGSVYVRVEDDSLKALDAVPAVSAADGTFKRIERSGRVRWQLPGGRRFVLRLENGRVLVEGYRGELQVLDDRIGRVVSVHSPFGLDFVMTNNRDGVLYVATKHGRIFALREPSPRESE